MQKSLRNDSLLIFQIYYRRYIIIYYHRLSQTRYIHIFTIFSIFVRFVREKGTVIRDIIVEQLASAIIFSSIDTKHLNIQTMYTFLQFVILFQSLLDLLGKRDFTYKSLRYESTLCLFSIDTIYYFHNLYSFRSLLDLLRYSRCNRRTRYHLFSIQLVNISLKYINH